MACRVVSIVGSVVDGLFALTLASTSHGHECTGPSIHNAFAESDDVLEHLERRVGYRDGGGLLQDLGDDREVCLEGTADCLGDVTKALEDGGLELVAERRALSKFVRKVLKLRMIR